MRRRVYLEFAPVLLESLRLALLTSDPYGTYSGPQFVDLNRACVTRFTDPVNDKFPFAGNSMQHALP